jgi:hypothetical protein
MKILITILLWLLLGGVACAQNPPNGIPCNAIGSAGAVTLCKPATTYGCNSGSTTQQMLATDGNRTSIQFQNTGGISVVLTFGDTGTLSNGFVVQPGNSYLWSNMSQGNTPGRVATSPISITSNGACTCVFLFTE